MTHYISDITNLQHELSTVRGKETKQTSRRKHRVYRAYSQFTHYGARTLLIDPLGRMPINAQRVHGFSINVKRASLLERN